MRIKLRTYDNATFIETGTPDEANIAARSIHKRNRHSNIYYTLIFEDGEQVNGSIDMEPKSFHVPHQREIVTGHLTTFWKNLSEATVKKYPYLTEEIIKEAGQIYTKIINELKN